MGKLATIAFLISFGLSTTVIDMILANETLYSQAETVKEDLRKKGALNKDGSIKKGVVKKLPKNEALIQFNKKYRKALQHNLPKAIPLGAGAATAIWGAGSVLFRKNRQRKPR